MRIQYYSAAGARRAQGRMCLAICKRGVIGACEWTARADSNQRGG